MQLRDLPSVDALAGRLAATAARPLPLPLVRVLARDAIDHARAEIAAGRAADPQGHAEALVRRLASLRPTRVVNATGVLLHTNLGRAPLAPEAAAAAAAQHTGYGNVEFDLGTGARGGRGAYVEELLTSLTGAQSALAVNNNAAALFLALAALAAPGGAVVSRGELIEIGGSFRLPDLMAASGADLVEVGTTNRTRRADYAAALPTARLVLKVHPSNYRIEGFAQETGYRELAELAHAHAIPFVADLGSGLLDTRTPWLEGHPPSWLSLEPGVRQTVELGADVVLFSGDKLLGGPQAGIAVGTREAIERMRRHPVARAVRLDGATAAALAATLEMYATGRGADIPFWRMAAASYEELDARHQRVLAQARAAGSVVAAASVPGAGSVPGETIPSPAIRLEASPDAAWEHLVSGTPPIIARRRDGALFVDLRSVEPGDDDTVAAALGALTGPGEDVRRQAE
jgi:L-seryl-tRNA(Ser) seleniumtransferase